MATTVKREVKSLPGLMTCNLDLHIEKATADYKWTGPKITQEEWWRILAFFRWTYTTCKSESQVRLYVNATTREWKAWAFPQKRNTGMTTDELPDHPNFAPSRALFGDDWFYYGTVHHHCAAGAFQSSTDERNEIDIAGLHITVGKLDTNRYDLDARLYQSQWKLTNQLDLADFWDVGDWARQQVPEELHGTVARYQMCVPAPVDYPFPKEWEDNYTVPPTPPPVVITHAPTGMGLSNVHQHWSDDHMSSTRRLFIEDSARLPSDIQYDCSQACKQVDQWCIKSERAEDCIEGVARCLEQLAEDPMLRELCRLMWLHDLSPGAFLHRLEEYIEEEELKAALQDAQKDNKQEEKRASDALAGEGNPYDDGYGMS